MKSMLVIGMGRFGRHLALKFASLGNEVMVIDKNEDRINEIISEITDGQIGDCTVEGVLRGIGVSNFDVCVVATGSNFQASLEITSLLKELGAKYVVVKTNRDIHGKFLLKSGADKVVYPEREYAESLAIKLNTHNIFECIELTPEFSIFEMPPKEAWLGKSIEHLQIRKKHHITILAIKKGKMVFPLPNVEYVFKPDEQLIVMSKTEDMFKI